MLISTYNPRTYSSLEEEVREILVQVNEKIEYYGIKGNLKRIYENKSLVRVPIPNSLKGTLEKELKTNPDQLALEIPFEKGYEENGKRGGYLYPEKPRGGEQYTHRMKENLKDKKKSHPLIGVICRLEDNTELALLTVNENALGIFTTDQNHKKIMPANIDFVKCLLTKIIDEPTKLITEIKRKSAGKGISSIGDTVRGL